METKSLKASRIILLIKSLILVAGALVFLFMPSTFVGGDFRVYVGQEFDDFAESNPQVATYLSLVARQLCVSDLLIGMYGIFIIFTAYKRREKWSWFALLTACVTGYGFTIFVNAYIGSNYWTYFTTASLVIALAGLAIGAKDLLGKGSS